MKEKIYDLAIDQPLTAARRQALNTFLTQNATGSFLKATHAWDEENDHLLHITTNPVKWELHFFPKKVVVYGSGPFWAKLLFTESKKRQLKAGIEMVLRKTGFVMDAVGLESAPKQAANKTPPNAK